MVSDQSQGQPPRKVASPTTVQAEIPATARVGLNRPKAQTSTTGARNQPWILVKSARPQASPATPIQRIGFLLSIALTVERRASVQKNAMKVSSAAMWA